MYTNILGKKNHLDFKFSKKVNLSDILKIII